MDQSILEAWLERIEPAMVRVFSTPKRWVGSAFAIGPRSLLTAYRVVEGLEPADVYLDGPAFPLPQRVQRIEADPERGVALLVLDTVAPEPASRLPIAATQPSSGQASIAAGYLGPEGPLSGFAIARDDPVLRTRPSAAGQPVPGGPVLVDGTVVGLIAPRDRDSTQTIRVPVSAWRPFLDQHAALIADDGERLTPEQAAMLTALRAPNTGTPLPFDLIDVVRSQAAASLTAYRLQRIAHWRQRDIRLDQRFIRRTLIAYNLRESPRTRQSAMRVGVFNHLDPLRAAHARELALVLTGVAGSGRSTYLARYEHELVLTALQDPAGSHPFVCFQTSDGARSAIADTTDPLAWLERQWSGLNPNLPSLFEWMRARPTVLLLDDLIEAPFRDTPKATKDRWNWGAALARLRKSFPLTQIVFTGAISGAVDRLQTPKSRSVPTVWFDPADEFEIMRAMRASRSRRPAQESFDTVARDGIDPTTSEVPGASFRSDTELEVEGDVDFYSINQYVHHLALEDNMIMPVASQRFADRARRPLTQADDPTPDPFVTALALDGSPFGTGVFDWNTPPLRAALNANDIERFVTIVAQYDLVLAIHCARAAKPPLRAQVQSQLRARLLARSQDPSVDLAERVEMGLMLGHFGDPRFGRRQGTDSAFIAPPLVRVRGGPYQIGSHCGTREQPTFTFLLDAFEIGQFPVTNAEWQCFIDAGGDDAARGWVAPSSQGRLEAANLGDHQTPHWARERFANPSQPVIGVSWHAARAYCRWLSRQSGRSFRLPTETEWEAAARQGTARLYPWEDDYDLDYANTAELNLRRTSPVGIFPLGATPGATPIHDLAGNCWEWTSSPFAPYPLTDAHRRAGRDPRSPVVIRGGAWSRPITYARATARWGLNPSTQTDTLGFRVVCPILPKDEETE